jgi:hypothetical protein
MFNFAYITYNFHASLRAYCFAAVGRSVGPSTVSVHFLRTQVAHTEMKFGYRFIIRMSRSSYGLGTIEPFLTELCPLDLEKFL